MIDSMHQEMGKYWRGTFRIMSLYNDMKRGLREHHHECALLIKRVTKIKKKKGQGESKGGRKWNQYLENKSDFQFTSPSAFDRLGNRVEKSANHRVFTTILLAGVWNTNETLLKMVLPRFNEVRGVIDLNTWVLTAQYRPLYC